MILIRFVFLVRAKHRVRIDKTGQIIDVAVCIVSGNTGFQPYDCLHAEKLLQIAKRLLASAPPERPPPAAGEILSDHARGGPL